MLRQRSSNYINFVLIIDLGPCINSIKMCWFSLGPPVTVLTSCWNTVALSTVLPHARRAVRRRVPTSHDVKLKTPLVGISELCSDELQSFDGLTERHVDVFMTKLENTLWKPLIRQFALYKLYADVINDNANMTHTPQCPIETWKGRKR